MHMPISPIVKAVKGNTKSIKAQNTHKNRHGHNYAQSNTKSALLSGIENMHTPF